MGEPGYNEIEKKMIKMGREYCIAHQLNPQKLKVGSYSKNMIIFAEPNPEDHSDFLDHSHLPFVTLFVRRKQDRETKEETFTFEETEYTEKYLK